MQIKCPNSEIHKRFKTKSAHVTQEWLVNIKGEYIKTITECIEVNHSPDENDSYICQTCGSEAEVE